MELWVRTQNRERLIKCENIYIDNIGYTSQTYYISADSINVGYKLGEYKTKERALEVLDEIQNLLKPPMIIQTTEGVIATTDNTIHIINPTYGKIEQISTYVYEMPEE